MRYSMAIGFGAICMLAGHAASLSAEPGREKPMLFANYYVWYHTGHHPRFGWSNWTREEAKRNTAALAAQRAGEPPLSSAAYPLVGLYDSADPAVAGWHVKLAQAAGIDAFLVSWWDTHRGRDRNFESGILAAAARRGFKVALLDERAQYHNDFEWYKAAVVRSLTKYKDSPAYLRLSGKPVLYLYQVASKPTLTPARFTELKQHVEGKIGPVYWIVDKIAHDHSARRAGEMDKVKRIPSDWLAVDGIDAFAFYSAFSHFRAHRYGELVGKYRYMVRLARNAGKKMLLPVHPGHDNSHFRDDPYVMPRRNGQTLRDYLRAADDAGADFVMVTSWNEWPETTVVEPSSTWRDPYLYLRILAEWKGVAFRIPSGPPRARRQRERVQPYEGTPSRTIRWDPATLTLVARPGGYGRMRRLRDGAILCSFERGGRSWTVRSTDEGRKWKKPVLAARYDFGNAANPETLELADGKVILAYNERPNDRPKDGKHPFAIRTRLSADGGLTWCAHSLVYEADTRWENGCWEPAMVQLPSGEVQLYFANESPYRKSAEQEISMARSTDGGKTWTRPKRVSFRRGRRDGMPVPLVLRGGKGIVIAIEDNGLRGRFKPALVHTTLADNWKGSHVDGGSPGRWGALKAPLPPAVYAGAPYIAQLPGGETVLSFQSTEGRREPIMVVYVGDDEARDFGGRSVPFDVARGSSGKWNSLFVKNEQTVTAISGATLRGVKGLWAVDGRLVEQ